LERVPGNILDADDAEHRERQALELVDLEIAVEIALAPDGESHHVARLERQAAGLRYGHDRWRDDGRGRAREREQERQHGCRETTIGVLRGRELEASDSDTVTAERVLRQAGV